MTQDMNQDAKLTPLGKILSFLLVAGLLVLGGYIVLNKGKTTHQTSNAGASKTGSSSAGGAESEAPASEAPDTGSVTTVKEYKYVPADKLPAVKGVSQYKWDNNNKTLRFSYNVWAGWLPVIAANHGTKPN